MARPSLRKARIAIIQNITLVISIVAISIGVYLSISFNKNIPRSLSPASSILALESMEKDLEQKNINHKTQLDEINHRLEELKEILTARQTGLEQLVNEVDDAKSRAQISEISGEGIVITLDDSGERKNNPNSIAHASDMRDLVNHLWNYGARAISITGAGDLEERIISTTSIDCIVNTVLINETKIVPPFTIKAIGEKDRLIESYNDTVSLKQIYDRVESEGLIFEMEESEMLTIGKYNGTIEVRNAKVK